MIRPAALLLSLLVACHQPADKPDSGLPTSDTDAPQPQDSGDTGLPAPVQVSDLSWCLHEEIGSVVYVSWRQSAAARVHVEYGFEGGGWLSSPSVEADAGTHEQILLGIPYDEAAGWNVVIEGGESFAGDTIATGPLPEQLPLPQVIASDSSRWEPSGDYLLGSINSDTGGWTSGQYWMFIVNRQGQVVWAWPGEDNNYTIYLRTTAGGDILWDVSTYWSAFDNGAGSKVHRMKIDGTIVETIPTPGMHHAFVDLPDGSLVWGAATATSEALLHRDLAGEMEQIWDCVPFYAARGLHDWCHTNSIFLSEATGTYLLSFPTDETFVLEIDATTGEELRWFGHIDGSWAFDPPQSAFQYQHGVTWTDAGTLLVSSQASPTSHDAVVREYTLDEEHETLVELWNQGLGDGIDADYAGEAHRLPGGNTLHNTGTTPRVREITPEGDIVWDLSFSGYRLIGRTTFIQDLYLFVP